MGMGSLATVGLQKAGQSLYRRARQRMLWRNRGQMSHTARGQLVGVAQACGIAMRTLDTMAEIEAFARTLQDVSAGPRFASVKDHPQSGARALESRRYVLLTRLPRFPGFGRSEGRTPRSTSSPKCIAHGKLVALQHIP